MTEQPKITPNDALNVLEMATANVQATRQEHELILRAIKTLREIHPPTGQNSVNGVKKELVTETKE